VKNEKTKLLLVSRTVPPVKSGTGYIVDQIRVFFSRDEIHIVGELPKNMDQRVEGVEYIDSNPIKFRRGNRFIKWYRWVMILSLSRNLMRISKAQNCTCILAIFPDEIYLESARIAAKKLKLPFYAYFHNTYLDNRTGFNKWMAKRIQAKVFREAKKVYVMSEGMMNHYQKTYANTLFEPLVHPFLPKEVPVRSGVPFSDGPLQISFLGNLNESNKDAFSFFVNAIAYRSDIQLKIISSTPAWFYKKLNLLKSNVEILSNVGDEELMSELQKANVLFLPHGFDGGLSQVEYDTIFPTRTIQYLFSGVPIFAFLPSNSFLCHFLKLHNCAELVCEKNEEHIVSMLLGMKSNVKRMDELVDNAIAISSMFKADVVLNELKKELFQER
jgi:glycosyltransferase involved in cell wall biosynthesis